jgi:hypothetical protein
MTGVSRFKVASVLPFVSRFAWAPAFVIALFAPGLAQAQIRRIVDLEIYTIHGDLDGHGRTSVFVAAPTIAFASGGVMPYVGGGLGFLTAQARVGLFFMPSDLQESSFVARVEVRPEIPLIPCLEPAIFGNVAAGYRFQLEEGPPGQFAGPAIYVMPAFDGGPAWIYPHCTQQGRPDEPLKSTFFFGGTVALGMDF